MPYSQVLHIPHVSQQNQTCRNFGGTHYNTCISFTGTLSRGRSYSRLSGVEYIADSTAHTLVASDHDDDTVSENEYSHSGADDEGDNSSVYHSSNEDVDSVNNSREYDQIYGSRTVLKLDSSRQENLPHVNMAFFYKIPYEVFCAWIFY